MKIDYSFNNEDLLKKSLTHPSICKDNKEDSYERLEFFGDKVLNFVIADLLWQQYPESSESSLSVMHSNLVNTHCLAKIANSIDLGASLKLAPGEEKNNGRQNHTILENSLEALIGAIYLDSNLDTVKKVISELWNESINDIDTIAQRDSKSLLQEWAQKNGKPIPVYEILEQAGEAHNPTFKVRVIVEGIDPCEASGSSKKIAQHDAASKMLGTINHD